MFDLRALLIATSVERRWQTDKVREGFPNVAYFDFAKADNESTAVTRSTVAVWRHAPMIERKSFSFPPALSPFSFLLSFSLSLSKSWHGRPRPSLELIKTIGPEEGHVFLSTASLGDALYLRIVAGYKGRKGAVLLSSRSTADNLTCQLQFTMSYISRR